VPMMGLNWFRQGCKDAGGAERFAPCRKAFRICRTNGNTMRAGDGVRIPDAHVIAAQGSFVGARVYA